MTLTRFIAEQSAGGLRPFRIHCKTARYGFQFLWLLAHTSAYQPGTSYFGFIINNN